MHLNSFRSFFKKYWKALSILFIVSALAYLPNITKFTLYKDDWYYIVDGFFGGPKIFREMFYIDRPLRGYLFEYLFKFLKTNPLPYQILAYIWRLISSMLYFGLLNLVWPKHEKTNLWISMLFLLYPGYLWWVSGVEYQPIILAQLLQVFSFGSMLLFLRKQNLFKKIFLLGCSAVAGWIGLMFVDYTIGMDLFRIVIIFFVVSHELPLAKTAIKIKKTLLSWLPFLIIPTGFMIWRTFFFKNMRPETNINIQMGQFLSAPLQVGLEWLQILIKSFVNINFSGWVKPFYDNFFSIGFSNLLIALALGLLGILVVKILMSKKGLLDAEESESGTEMLHWEREAFIGGVIGVVGGIIPIVLMNREINIESYSHYLLNILMAAAPILFAVIHWLRSKKLREGVLLALIGFLIISNYSYSVKVVKEENTIADFWKQVLIRAPGFVKGTTFLVNLPNSYGSDNSDAAWAPVNYLYADSSRINIADGIVNYPFAGLDQQVKSSQKILINNESESGYRSHLLFPKFDQLVVISQPSLDSCVHVMDSRWPRLTFSDNDQVLLTSSKSDVKNILLQRTFLYLDEKIFGKLNENNWCAIYQKAELALQFENWEQIAVLRSDANTRGFSPVQQIEWMPFLQEAIYRGNSEQIKSLMSNITDPFVLSQACTTYEIMQNEGYFKDVDSMNKNKAFVCLNHE